MITTFRGIRLSYMEAENHPAFRGLRSTFVSPEAPTFRGLKFTTLSPPATTFRGLNFSILSPNSPTFRGAKFSFEPPGIERDIMFPGQSLIMETNNRSLPAKSLIMETRNKSFPAESLIMSTENKALRAESLIMETKNKSLPAKSLIMETRNKSFPVRSLIMVTENKLLLAESLIMSQKSKTFNGLSLIMPELDKTFHGISLIQETRNRDFSGISFIAEDTLMTHSDSNDVGFKIPIEVPIAFESNDVLYDQGTNAITSSGDRVLYVWIQNDTATRSRFLMGRLSSKSNDKTFNAIKLSEIPDPEGVKASFMPATQEWVVVWIRSGVIYACTWDINLQNPRLSEFLVTTNAPISGDSLFRFDINNNLETYFPSPPDCFDIGCDDAGNIMILYYNTGTGGELAIISSAIVPVISYFPITNASQDSSNKMVVHTTIANGETSGNISVLYYVPPVLPGGSGEIKVDRYLRNGGVFDRLEFVVANHSVGDTKFMDILGRPGNEGWIVCWSCNGETFPQHDNHIFYRVFDGEIGDFIWPEINIQNVGPASIGNLTIFSADICPTPATSGDYSFMIKCCIAGAGNSVSFVFVKIKADPNKMGHIDHLPQEQLIFPPSSPGDRASVINRISSFGYQLQGYTTTDPSVPDDTITNSNYNLIIMDYAINGDEITEFTKSAVATMRNRQNKNKSKLLIAYMSIGAAQQNRFYWDPTWVTEGPPGAFTLNMAAPTWLSDYDPVTGSFRVKYWMDEWQQMIVRNSGSHPIIGNNPSWLDRIIDAGFDGVYLDNIDSFAKFGPHEIGGNDSKLKAPEEMINFVSYINNYARNIRGKKDFFIIPQNGAGIIDISAYPDRDSIIPSPLFTQEEWVAAMKSTYLDSIDAIGSENSFYAGSGDNNLLDLISTETNRKMLYRYRTENKPVLATDYLAPGQPNPHNLIFPDTINEFYSLAREARFIPYATDRSRDVLTINPSQMPPSIPLFPEGDKYAATSIGSVNEYEYAHLYKSGDQIGQEIFVSSSIYLGLWQIARPAAVFAQPETEKDHDAKIKANGIYQNYITGSKLGADVSGLANDYETRRSPIGWPNVASFEDFLGTLHGEEDTIIIGGPLGSQVAANFMGNPNVFLTHALLVLQQDLGFLDVKFTNIPPEVPGPVDGFTFGNDAPKISIENGNGTFIQTRHIADIPLIGQKVVDYAIIIRMPITLKGTQHVPSVIFFAGINRIGTESAAHCLANPELVHLGQSSACLVILTYDTTFDTRTQDYVPGTTGTIKVIPIRDVHENDTLGNL